MINSLKTYHYFYFLVSFLFFAEILSAKSEISLSDKKLTEIITTQERFFSQSKSENKPSLKEMTRQAQEIVTAYESYLSHNPEDTNAIILFGKFLRQVGQEEYAVEFFLRADQVNPKLAVVKQQLANYLVEKGRPVDAFPYFIMTLELAPKEAVYHFHLGNFLFLFQSELIQEGIISENSARSFMHRSFREASKLDNNNFDFLLRYAQSFFDFAESDKNEALNIWEKIEKDFPGRSKIEKEYFRLCKARVLLQLNRKKDASSLIKTVSSESFKDVKEALMLRVKKEKNESLRTNKNEKLLNKQSFHEPNHKHFLPTDPHLERLRKITTKLVEEKMLNDLETDAIEAKYNQDGQIKIEFSKVP